MLSVADIKLHYSTNQVVLRVPKTMDSALCGMCGNNNGDATDDFKSPGGLQLSNPIDFGNNWQDRADFRGETRTELSILNAPEELRMRDATAVSSKCGI